MGCETVPGGTEVIVSSAATVNVVISSPFSSERVVFTIHNEAVDFFLEEVWWKI